MQIPGGIRNPPPPLDPRMHKNNLKYSFSDADQDSCAIISIIDDAYSIVIFYDLLLKITHTRFFLPEDICEYFGLVRNI